MNLFDGAAEPVTDDYFNVEYFPPWDLWLALVPVDDIPEDLCLLSWVPPWAEPLVVAGIEVDPAECLSWAKWVGDGLEVVGWGQAR
jgi:hypothetical protein